MNERTKNSKFMKSLAFLASYAAKAKLSFEGYRLTATEIRYNYSQILLHSAIKYAATFLLSIFLTACGKDSNTVNNYQKNSPLHDTVTGGGGATGDGGGGQGVLCEESPNASLSNKLFIRDIYEATFNHKRAMKELPNNADVNDVSEKSIQILTDSLKQYFGPASTSFESVRPDFWKSFIKQISFLDDERILHPSQDANSPIALQGTCRIVQIAYWDESSGDEGTLYVSQSLWRRLDQLNKIALLAHEYFFAQARKAGYKNSDSVRYKIGQLLSKDGIPPLFKHWVPTENKSLDKNFPKYLRGFKSCFGASKDDPKSKILVYFYSGQYSQFITFPKIISSSINSAYLQGVEFPVYDDIVNSATNLWVLQSDLDGDDITYSDLPKIETLINRWYRNSGVINDNWATGIYNSPYIKDGYNLKSASQQFADTIRGLSTSGAAIWSTYLMTSPTPIKVTLLNSFKNQRSHETSEQKTREELLLISNQELKSTLTKCKLPKSSIEKVLSVLNKEINDFTSGDQYKGEFPKWISALKALELEYLNETLDKSCNLSTNDRLTTSLPSYIYNVKQFTYSPSETVEVLGQSAFRLNDAPISLGEILVEQDGSSLKFQLHCGSSVDSYITSLSSALDEKANQEPIPAPEKNIINTFHPFPSLYSDLDTTNVTKYLEYISAKSSQDLSKTYQDMWPPKRKQSAYAISLEDITKYFISDLISEKEILVKECDQNYAEFFAADGVTLKHSTCLLHTMKTFDRTYMVYFSYELAQNSKQTDFVPKLEYVQLVLPNFTDPTIERKKK